MKKTIIGIVIGVSVATHAQASKLGSYRIPNTNTTESAKATATQPSDDNAQHVKKLHITTREERREQCRKLVETMRQKCSTIPLTENSPQTHWERNVASTNNVDVSVCVGIMKCGDTPSYYVFRTLTFDPEGRLLSISNVNDIRRIADYGNNLIEPF